MVIKAKTLCILLLCLLGAVGPLRAALLPLGTPFDIRVRDRSGTAWAISNGGNSGTIYRQESRGWQEEMPPGAAGFTAHSLTRGDDGSVYAFWQTQNETPARSLVTVHRGLASRVLAHFTVPIFSGWSGNATPALWAGVGGDVWLMGNVQTLYHLTPDGNVMPFPLKPEQYGGGHLPDDFPPTLLSSVIDGQGRRWFWQDTGTFFWSRGSFRGFLIWDGKSMAYHATLPDFPDAPGPQTGLPINPFLTLAPLDAHHLWLSVLGFPWERTTRGGLYRLNTDTLAAVRETPPAKGAFQNVTQVFQANDDWYVVEAPNQGDRTPLLWRSRGKRWQKCVARLEEPGGYFKDGGRYAWQAEPRGVWVGVSAGLWWIPKNRAPTMWADWHRGMSASGNSTRGFVTDLPLFPPPLLPPRPGVVPGGIGASKGITLLLTDIRHHLWGLNLYNTMTPSLDEWDGRRWRKRELPKSIPGIDALYACDTFGRLWLSTSNWNPPKQPQPIESYAIYDPAHDAWTNYATKPDALQAAAYPGMAFLPRHDLNQPPLFSRDGHVTCVEDGGKIALYDGHVWRRWATSDIVLGYAYSNSPDPPHFNSENLLETAVGDKIQTWMPPGVWQQMGDRKPVAYEDPVPHGGPRGLWAYPAVDSLGDKWFTWQGEVYVAGHGLWAKQAALSGRGSPFWDGRSIEDVLRDPIGRLFFVTRPGGYSDYVVWTPPATPPAPRIRVTPLAADAVALTFFSTKNGAPNFLWRLNGGEWSAPQQNDVVRLEDLSPGDYRIEAQAIDRLLQTSAQPSSAAFAIRPATTALVAQWVQTLLSGNDDAREAAARGLKKQPELALPALHAARSGASGQRCWWIDAVLQQIEPEP